MSDENRIYIVVAQTVDTPNGLIFQPCGRAMAQAGHARGKMEVTSRIYRNRDTERKKDLEEMPFEENTAINLMARDSKELAHIDLLLLKSGIMRFPFFDKNLGVYGIAENGEAARIMTAICTVPENPQEFVGILDYLPLWDCKCA